MKTITKLTALLLLLSLTFTILASCSKKSNEFVLETPSEKLQAKFKREYINFRKYDVKDPPDVTIEEWYGMFGNIGFLLISDGFMIPTLAYWSETVGESEFIYNDGRSITVWIDGQFFKLKEAYEKNLITSEMVKTIEDVYKGKYGQIIKP